MNSRCWITLRILAVGLAAGLTWGTAESAAQEPSRRVSLEEAIQLFRENSLELQLARADLEERFGNARQSRAYFNPTVSLWREELSRDADDYHETLLSLDQRLEWPGRTAARLRGADRTVEAAEQRFLADSLRLAFQVRRGFIEAALVEEEMTVLGATTELLRGAIADAEVRFADGDLSAYELRRLRLELARYEQALASAELELRSAWRTFTALLQPEAEAEIVAPDSLPRTAPPPVTELEGRRAIVGRPDVTAAALHVEAEGAVARAASQAWIPYLTLSGGYKDQSDGFSGAVLGAAVGLPLFNRDGGRAQAAEARHRAAIARLALTRRHAENDVAASHARYASVTERARRVGRGLLGEADRLLSAARISYAEGEMTLLELLDAVNAYRDARLIVLRLHGEHWTAYFDLVRAIGGEPQHESDGGER